MPRITAGTKIQLTSLLLLSLLLPLLLSTFCDSEMCLWGKCHGRSNLALLDILSGPSSTQYSGSWFSPLSVGIFIPRTYAFISLSWLLKRGPERNKEKAIVIGACLWGGRELLFGSWSCTHTVCRESRHMMKAGFQRHLPYYPTSVSKTERRKWSKPLRLACPQQRLRGFSEAQMCGSYGDLDWLLMEFIFTTEKKRLFLKSELLL